MEVESEPIMGASTKPETETETAIYAHYVLFSASLIETVSVSVSVFYSLQKKCITILYKSPQAFRKHVPSVEM